MNRVPRIEEPLRTGNRSASEACEICFWPFTRQQGLSARVNPNGKLAGFAIIEFWKKKVASWCLLIQKIFRLGHLHSGDFGCFWHIQLQNHPNYLRSRHLLCVFLRGVGGGAPKSKHLWARGRRDFCFWTFTPNWVCVGWAKRLPPPPPQARSAGGGDHAKVFDETLPLHSKKWVFWGIVGIFKTNTSLSLWAASTKEVLWYTTLNLLIRCSIYTWLSERQLLGEQKTVLLGAQTTSTVARWARVVSYQTPGLLWSTN